MNRRDAKSFEEECGMALAEDEDIQASVKPFQFPLSKIDWRARPEMAVYVAIESKAITKRKAESVNDRTVNVLQMIMPTSVSEKLFEQGRADVTIERSPTVTVSDSQPATISSKTTAVSSKSIQAATVDTLSSKAMNSQVHVTTMQIGLIGDKKRTSTTATKPSDTSCGDVHNSLNAFPKDIKNKVFHWTEEAYDKSFSGGTSSDRSLQQKSSQEVFTVEFQADSREVVEAHRRCQVLVAEEAFSTEFEQSKEDVAWLRDLLAEAKAVINSSLFISPMFVPENKSMTLHLGNTTKPFKAPTPHKIAQNLMHLLISEVFDPNEMVEMHVAVRLPHSVSPPAPNDGNNYTVSLCTSVSTSKIPTSSSRSPSTASVVKVVSAKDVNFQKNLSKVELIKASVDEVESESFLVESGAKPLSYSTTDETCSVTSAVSEKTKSIVPISSAVKAPKPLEPNVSSFVSATAAQVDATDSKLNFERVAKVEFKILSKLEPVELESHETCVPAQPEPEISSSTVKSEDVTCTATVKSSEQFPLFESEKLSTVENGLFGKSGLFVNLSSGDQQMYRRVPNVDSEEASNAEYFYKLMNSMGGGGSYEYGLREFNGSICPCCGFQKRIQPPSVATSNRNTCSKSTSSLRRFASKLARRIKKCRVKYD